MSVVVERALCLPPPGEATFFLWGARQTGKSSLLRESYPTVRWLDLLQAEAFRRYFTNPEFLRQEIEQSGDRFVVIDEIQKVPALLDEAQWLHENRQIHFALCGSSARKLKRGQGNLLGGRAVRFELYGFSAFELGDSFDLDRVLNHGTMPRPYLAQQPRRLWNAYVADYLKEEIMAEGLVRNLPPFSRFLDAAGLCDCEQINFTNIARELGVSRDAVRGYFDILVDTLMATFLPVYRRRPKRRLSVSDKFYFHDVGVVNFLAKRGAVRRGSDLFGKAFENWIFHELRCYNAYRERFAQFSFWRLAGGQEVDFIVNDLECAVECKASARVVSHHLKGLRELAKDYAVKRRMVVCLEPISRRTEDGIEILTVDDFLGLLWRGDLF